MVTIREEMVHCNKKTCTTCPHGPYGYAYWKEGGKLHRKYLGKGISKESFQRYKEIKGADILEQIEKVRTKFQKVPEVAVAAFSQPDPVVPPLPIIPQEPTYPHNYKNKDATRKEMNDFLRTKGFRWRKETIYVDGAMAMDPELEDYEGDFKNIWVLRGSDGTKIENSEMLLRDLGFYGDEIKKYNDEMVIYNNAVRERKRAINQRATEIREKLRGLEGDHLEKVDQFADDKVYHVPGDGFNIYGGGFAYAVTDEAIWSIKNNGMDGDNWAYNNYKSGGAGAIAVKYSHDPYLAALIKSLPQGFYD